jgi:glycosyltransferase involved in cell wall biosynthesis
MPCYNAMPYLPEALESIMHQTYTNLEILCINDGSSDETPEVLERYAAQDKRIRVVHNETNLKLIATLNKGVGLARGEFIARMDADDVAFAERIAVCIDYFQRNPSCDLVAPASWNITETGELLNKNLNRFTDDKAALFASFFFVPFGHPEIMCRTEVMKDNPYSTEPDALHTEDFELWCRLLHKGYVLRNIPEVLQKIRINSQSVSRTFESLQDDNFVRVSNRYYNNYFHTNLSLTLSKVVCNRLDAQISCSDFIQGFRLIKQTKKVYCSKVECTDPAIKLQLSNIIRTHRVDVLIQGVKRGKWCVKLQSILLLTVHLPLMLLLLKGRRYLKHKFRKSLHN